MNLDTEAPPAAMPDPVAPATPPDAGDAEPKSSFTLSADQLAEAGLTDCKPGESYTGVINFRVSDAGDLGDAEGKTFEIDSVSDAAPADAGAAAPPEGAPPGGAPSDLPPAEPDLPLPSGEEDMLGYKRPQKSKPFPKIQGLKG